VKGIDIRTVGSKNVGATNVFRSVGPVAGLATLLVDMAKGFLPVYFLTRGRGEVTALLCGVGAVAGHTWSPFVGFRGGKGVATSAGVFAALLPGPTLAAVSVFGALFALTRRVSAGSLGAAVALPVAAFAWKGNHPRSWLALAVGTLVALRHIPNIRRLIRGEEQPLFPARRDES
jgi:glycerol-3-phosphate acyltransferase PlsY